MGTLRRERRHIQLYLTGPTVADAVQAIRQRQAQERSSRVSLSVRDDGRLRAVMLMGGGRVRFPLVLTGHLDAEDGGVVLYGKIREGRTQIVLLLIFLGVAAFLAALGLLIVLNEPRGPGGYILMALGVLLGLSGYRPKRLRFSGFDGQCTDLLRALAPLLPPERLGW